MLIQLRSIQTIIIESNPRRCYPGDWVDVGKQQALQWLETGEAWRPDGGEGALPDDAGIVVLGDVSAARKVFSRYIEDLDFTAADEPTLPYTRSMIWDPALAFTMPHRIATGFDVLDTWQVAVPLRSYTELAGEAGTPEDRDRTRELIGDLRVMVYDPRLVFVRRSSDTLAFIETWQAEAADGGDPALAFLRALYQAQLLTLALPVSWTGKPR